MRHHHKLLCVAVSVFFPLFLSCSGSKSLPPGITPLDLDGIVTSLAGGGVISEETLDNPRGVAVDNTYAYVCDGDNNVIRRITISDGTIATYAGSIGSPGSTDGTRLNAKFNNPYGVTKIGAILYIADTDNHTIRKVDTSSGNVTTIAGLAGTAGSDGDDDDNAGVIKSTFNCPQGLGNDGTDLYVADTGNHKIRKITISDGNVTTISGTGTAGHDDTTDPQITPATFNNPRAVVVDGTNIFVVDGGSGIDLTQYNNNIRKIDTTNGNVSTIAGLANTPGSDNDPDSDPLTINSRFRNPYGITIVGTNLYVSDTDNHTIRKIDTTKGNVSTPLGSAGQMGSTTDVSGNLARFRYPQGITNDGTNLYVSDTGNNTIRKIVIASNSVTTLAGIPADTLFANGTGTQARFNKPLGITSNGTHLFVTDTNNHIVRKIEIATKEVTTWAGQAKIPGYDNGAGLTAKFREPEGITNDGTYLYVCDTKNNTVRQISISKGDVTTLAGSAVENSDSNDGTGTGARFRTPRGITNDGTYLYVADCDNHTIRKIEIAGGVVTTLAGYPGTQGNTNGTGNLARFRYPNGIAVVGTSVYLSDTGNHTIRKIDTASDDHNVTTIAGSAGSAGSTDGTGLEAKFNNPTGIMSDGTYLYISDRNNQTIRRIEIATSKVATLVGSAGQAGLTNGTGTQARFDNPGGLAMDGTHLYVADTFNSGIRKIE